MRALVFLTLFVLLALRITAIFVIPPVSEEIVHLQIANDISRFVQLPIYFYQQEYMGPLECYLMAPLVRLFGSSLLAGRFYNSFFFIAFLGIYFMVVRRLFGQRLSGYVLALLAVLPFPALFFTTVVGWAESLTLAALCLFLLLKTGEDAGKRIWPSLLLGFVSGISFWTNPIFVIWLAAILAGLIGVVPETWKKGIPLRFLAGFALGLFPIWTHLIQTGTLMRMEGASDSSARFSNFSYVPKVFYLFFARMKYFFTAWSGGMEPPFAAASLRGVSLIPFALFAASFTSLALFFLRRRHGMSTEEKLFHLFILIPPLILLPIYSFRNFIRDEGMRFFLPLIVPYAFAISWWLCQRQAAILRRAILGLLLGIQLAGIFFSSQTALRNRAELEKLIQFLEEKGLTTGIAEFGLAYSLNALSQDRLLVTPPWYHAALRPLLDKVRERGPRFFILHQTSERFRRRLEEDSNLEKASLAHCDIYYGNSELLKQFVTVGELKEE